jgi:hypothetical protein
MGALHCSHPNLSTSAVGQAPETHACNLSYSGGRDHEDRGSKPAQVNCEILPQKYPTQERAGRMAQVVERLPSQCECCQKRMSAVSEMSTVLALEALAALSGPRHWPPQNPLGHFQFARVQAHVQRSWPPVGCV